MQTHRENAQDEINKASLSNVKGDLFTTFEHLVRAKHYIQQAIRQKSEIYAVNQKKKIEVNQNGN